MDFEQPQKVEDMELAREIADIENPAREWAKHLAEAIKNPDKANTRHFPPILTDIDIDNMINMGVTPEDVVAYGEECAKQIESLAKYIESLVGMTKAQLTKEYFKQFIDGFTNSIKRRNAYDETKKVHFYSAPDAVAQPKEYWDATNSEKANIQKRSLVWDRIKHGELKE